MRLLPSAKVCFLGGCPQSGRNQNLYRRIAKQKTAVPQGAASLSLAVLESDGRKREGSSDEQCELWGVGRLGENSGRRECAGCPTAVTVGKARLPRQRLEPFGSPRAALRSDCWQRSALSHSH